MTRAQTAVAFTFLTASDGTEGDQFGWRVVLHNNVLVVGANQGDAAYVFLKSPSSLGSDRWVQRHKLTASDGASGDQFGISTAIEKTSGRIAVGARLDDSGAGSAYIFEVEGVQSV